MRFDLAVYSIQRSGLRYPVPMFMQFDSDVCATGFRRLCDSISRFMLFEDIF
jgi:hypothetical protein